MITRGQTERWLNFQNRGKTPAAPQLGLRREAESHDRQDPQERAAQEDQAIPGLRAQRVPLLLHVNNRYLGNLRNRLARPQNENENSSVVSSFIYFRRLMNWKTGPVPDVTSQKSMYLHHLLLTEACDSSNRPQKARPTRALKNPKHLPTSVSLQHDALQC